MLPEDRSSSISFGGIYLPPDERNTSPLVDYEIGGLAINNAAGGLMQRVWKSWVDGVNVMLQPEGGEPILLFTAVDITELALAFDQNMQWSIGYIQAGLLKLRWFDSLAGGYTTSVFTTARNPRMTLDDKRPQTLSRSDVILAYLRDNSLYYRQQRDRFLIERELRDNIYPGMRLKSIGMNKNLRLQFELV